MREVCRLSRSVHRNVEFQPAVMPLGAVLTAMLLVGSPGARLALQATPTLYGLLVQVQN